MTLNRITVFCGSSSGTDPVYTTAAHSLGQLLAKAKIGLVYGGANVGLMGAVADGVLEEGGEAIGVIPNFLRSNEIAHQGLTELVEVENMHQRKTIMHERCDGIIALPGGFGTLEELFEMLTWAQLGLHKKPIGLLNVQGFYDALTGFIQTMVDRGFLKPENQRMLLVSDDASDLLTQMRAYQPPTVGKWLNKEEV